MAKEGGMVAGGEGTSHANGGVKFIVKDTGKLIEVEGDEFVFCSDVTQSDRIHTFTGTPYEILIALAKEYNCSVGALKGIDGREFVICKKVVRDGTPITITGTPREIISKMQVEKGCNPHWSYKGEPSDGENCDVCAHEQAEKHERERAMAKGGDVKTTDKKIVSSSFKVAADLMIAAHYNKANISFFGKPYLVHAEVTGNGKYAGQRFGHAWVEDNDLVYDFSSGKQIILPKQRYYQLAAVKTSDPAKYVRYTYEQLAKKLLTSKGYCWDLKTVFELGGSVLSYEPDMSKAEVFQTGGAVQGLRFEKLSDNIFQVTGNTQEILAKTFIRFNAYLDSAGFKGKVFTLDEFKKWYADGGKFTYYSDFKGFNVPDHVFEIFERGKFNPLSTEEKWLLDKVKGSAKPFYVIGYVDVPSEKVTKKHELAHTFYYLQPQYKQEVDAILSRMNKALGVSDTDRLNDFMRDSTYEKSSWPDEMQAYLIADKAHLIEKGAWSNAYQKYSDELNAVFDKWYAKLFGDKKMERGGALNDMYEKMIHSKSFKQKFGDWETAYLTAGLNFKHPTWKNVSKVVDNGGRPLLVYHGTNNSFSKFDSKFYGTTNGRSPANVSGAFFTDNKKVAKSYGKNVSPYFIIIKNPIILDAQGRDYSNFKREVNDAAEKMKKSDKDGVFILNYRDAGIYAKDTIESDNFIVKDISAILNADVMEKGGAVNNQSSASPFQQRLIAAQDLAKELKDAYNGKLTINYDNASITLYHLTGVQNADKIRERGFNAGTFFFSSKSSNYNGDTLLNYRTKHHGYVIMEVKVNPQDVSFSSGTGEFYAENALKMNTDWYFYEAMAPPKKYGENGNENVQFKKGGEIEKSNKEDFRSALKSLLLPANQGLSLMLRGEEKFIRGIGSAFTYTSRGTHKKTYDVSVSVYKSEKGTRYVAEDDGLIIAAAFVDNNNKLTGIITADGMENVGIGTNLYKTILSVNPDVKPEGIASQQGQKLFDRVSKMENGGGIPEDAQMYIDIIADHPNLERNGKYKAILKDEFGIDFDSMYKDEEYIASANLNDIKAQDDFLSFDNWLKYGKIISEKRGFIRPDAFDKAMGIEVTDEELAAIAKKLDFELAKMPYVESRGNGSVARVEGNTLKYAFMDGYYLAHELGHLFSQKLDITGWAALMATNAPTKYGATNQGEGFAENFAIYFIAPEWLKKNLPAVYSELDARIPSLWKNEINNVLNKGVKMASGGSVGQHENIDEETKSFIVANVLGGHAKGMNNADIAKMHGLPVEAIEEQMKKGKVIELEHTPYENVAELIARDHLYEFPDYYTQLDNIEHPKGEAGEVLTDCDFIWNGAKLKDGESIDAENYGKFILKNGCPAIKKYKSPPPVSYTDIEAIPKHSWTYRNGKHYDDQTPNGVDSFWDLPIYKNEFKYGGAVNKGIVPYGVAEKLKDIGYDEPSASYYISDKSLVNNPKPKHGNIYPSNSDLLLDWISAPTYKEVAHWLSKNEDKRERLGEYKAPFNKFMDGGDVEHSLFGGNTDEFESAAPDYTVESPVIINHDPQVDSFEVDSWEKGGMIMEKGGAVAPYVPTKKELEERWDKKKDHIMQLSSNIRKLRYNITMTITDYLKQE